MKASLAHNGSRSHESPDKRRQLSASAFHENHSRRSWAVQQHWPMPLISCTEIPPGEIWMVEVDGKTVIGKVLMGGGQGE